MATKDSIKVSVAAARRDLRRVRQHRRAMAALARVTASLPSGDARGASAH